MMQLTNQTRLVSNNLHSSVSKFNIPATVHMSDSEKSNKKFSMLIDQTPFEFWDEPNTNKN